MIFIVYHPYTAVYFISTKALTMKNQEWTPTCLFLSIFMLYSGWFWITHVFNLLFNKLHLQQSHRCQLLLLELGIFPVNLVNCCGGGFTAGVNCDHCVFIQSAFKKYRAIMLNWAAEKLLCLQKFPVFSSFIMVMSEIFSKTI